MLLCKLGITLTSGKLTDKTTPMKKGARLSPCTPIFHDKSILD